MSQYAHVNTYMHIIFYKSYTHFTLQCISYSIYPLYSTNCADEFHTLRCRVVRCTYTIILWAQSTKMGDSCAFDIQCYKFPLYYIIVWNEELLGLKKQQVNNGKFT